MSIFFFIQSIIAGLFIAFHKSPYTPKKSLRKQYKYIQVKFTDDKEMSFIFL